MHATQPQGGACPERHDSDRTSNFVAELFNDDERFRAWVALAPATAAQPTATPDQPDPKAMTQQEFHRWAQGSSPAGVPASLFESDAWFEAAHETYADGELDQDRIPSSEGFKSWYRRQLTELFAHPGDLPTWVRSVLRESQDGYVLTEQGQRALDEAPADEEPGTAASVLRSAALYLERHGWIQGVYYDATSGSFTPPACLVGAIGMVCYGGPVDAPAQHFDDPGFLDFEEAVLHLDRYLLAEDCSESYEFNDAKGRTVDQVTDVLRKAAARPAEELIDAIRAIDARNAETAALVDLLKPRGLWGDPAATASSDLDEDETNFVDCLFCGAPGGYPYCQGSFGGQMSCADIVAADDAAQGGDGE